MIFRKDNFIVFLRFGRRNYLCCVYASLSRWNFVSELYGIPKCIQMSGAVPIGTINHFPYAVHDL